MADFITVDEAATRLNMSVQTVRRRLADGTLKGEKVGRAWLVDETKLPKLASARADRGARSGVLPVDLPAALRHVRRTDLSELWVPDVLRWEDHLAGPEEELFADVLDRLTTPRCDPPIEVDVPKTPVTTRAATHLSFEDRIAYQAVVSIIAERLEPRLSPRVHSARLSLEPEFFLQRSARAFACWLKAVYRDFDENGPWLIRTDLASYFDTIDHDLLLAEVASLGGMHPKLLDALRNFLGRWSRREECGIPQGPNASRVLGNLFLLPVDRSLESAGFRSWRYMDDIRIIANTRSQAVKAIRMLEGECRRRGLILNSSKTEMLSGVDARERIEDDEVAAADYLFEAADRGKEARKALRSIWKSSMDASGGLDVSRAKFALWRLARLADKLPLKSVLMRLEHLGPIASASAAYFRAFLQSGEVEVGLAEYFEDPNRNTSDFTETWLFAAALERPKKMPDRWIARARNVARDRNASAFHRGIAANLLAMGRESRDITWLKDQVAREYDPDMVRACLAALARVRKLDRQIEQIAVKRLPHMVRTVQYLRGRRDLPSLVYRGRRFVVS